VALPTLNWLLSSEHELALVITQPDRPAGRGRTLKESAVSVWAHDNHIECFKPATAAEIAPLLENVDLLLTIGYGVLLPSDLLAIPRNGCLNLHFSLLPRWRGAAPVQRAIESGDALTGVTVFQLDPGMDTGPIYSLKRFALDSDITSDELFHELALLGVESVEEAIAAISEGIKPQKQPIDGATRALKISKEECEINWSQDAQTVSQKIRAFTSLPGAWTRFRGDVIKVDSVKISDQSLAPGTIKVIERELFVGTSTHAISIGFLTPSGKPRMDARSWLNGARVSEGEIFG
jgi:methionyl-tRNA formyltransferase